MKKAKSVEDIYKIFNPNQSLEENDLDFYVDIYHDELRRFSTALKFNAEENKSFFITGQAGNGKSTMLKLLPINYPEINNKYHYHYISCAKELNLFEKIDIIDILIIISYRLVRNSEILQKKYLKKLNLLQDVENSILDENSKLSINFLSFFKFSTSLNSSSNINEDVKKLVKIRKKEFIDLINEMVLDYKISINNDKELLIVIDDLEKIKDSEEFFLKDINLLNELNMSKIITLPLTLYRKERLPYYDIREFGLKIKTYDNQIYIKDIECLRKIICSRLEYELISDDALYLAVEYSGANLRQLIKIIHKASEEAIILDLDSIDKESIYRSIETLKKDFASSSMMMKTFLTEISETKQYNQIDDNISKALKEGLIFSYFNGLIWYDVNPLVLESLDIYNSNLNLSPTLLNHIDEYNESIILNKYINNIQIKNYFSIKNIEFKNLINNHEIYLVGENGDGKTIILQALALAYKDPKQYPLLAKEYIQNMKEKSTLDIIDEEKFVNKNLFAYGINRNKIDADESDSSGYAGLFDTPYLKSTTFLHRPQDLFIMNTPLTNNFKDKLENLLENKVEIRIEKQKNHEEKKIIFYENKSDDPIEFKMLSEGYKSTIIWLSDLVYRLINNQPEVTKIEGFKSVVLVDEIDLYLHPKWRYKFVYNLRNIFPKIQFIMTTHSPTTILGASKDAVFYTVSKDKEGYTQLSEQYDDISDYSANILITSPLFNMDSAKARSYNDKRNNLSDDNYEEHQYNKQIDDMILSNNDKDIKNNLLSKLKEYNEKI